MGFRTVVVLYNDQASTWEADAELGKKIARAMNSAMGHTPDREADLGYGKVVECTHADTQTLAVLDGYGFQSLAYDHWWANKTDEELQLRLLKEAAEKLGYRLTRMPQKKVSAPA